jgi:hypothetical protein
MKIRQFTLKIVLAIAAGFEALTGVALILVPRVVVRALLGGEIAGAGIAVSRICGLAMVALGIACWPWPEPARSALRALLFYNLIITPYLALQLVRGTTVRGLGAALLIHAVLTIFLAVAAISAERGERKREAYEVADAAPQGVSTPVESNGK